MPVEQIAGREIRVLRKGGNADVLMIHCSLGRSEMLLPLRAALDEPAILFDLPGHGDSGAWNGEGDYQRATAAVGATLCDRPCHIIGHSFGATVALRIAVETPDRVTRLTLIEPVLFAAAKGTDAHAAHEAAFAPFVAALAAGDKALATAAFHNIWGLGAWRSLPAPVQADLVKRIGLVVAGAPAVEDDADGVLERLGAVDVPVTLVRGAESPAVIAEIHAELQRRIPQATDAVVPGAGHMLAFTHPREVAAIIRAAPTGTGQLQHCPSTSP